MKAIKVKVCPKCQSIQIGFGKKNITYGPGSEAWTPDKKVYECRQCGQRTDSSQIATIDEEVTDDTTLCPECGGFRWSFSNSRIEDTTLLRCLHCNAVMLPKERVRMP